MSQVVNTSKKDFMTTAMLDEIRAEIEAEAVAAWDKDFTVGSGDDHCHSFSKSMKKAMAKWSAAAGKEIDECWFGGEAGKRAEMIWALSYRSAAKYAGNVGMAGRAVMTFAKDVASVATGELIIADKTAVDGSAVAYICGRAKRRAMDAVRNAGKSVIKATVYGKEKGGYSNADKAVGEAYGDLYNAMAELKAKNEDWFDIVDKSFFKGMTYEEIAKEAGIKKTSVGEKAARALAFLKAAVAYA